MGNIHFNANCLNLPSEHTTTSTIINTQPSIATPLMSLCSSSASSFDLTVLITQPIIDLLKILSNHSNTNHTMLNALPTYTPNTDDCKYTEHSAYKRVSIECDTQMPFNAILARFSLIPLFNINTIKICCVDETIMEETHAIHDINSNICDTLQLSPNSACDVTLQISLCEKWFCNTLHEIIQIDFWINEVITETRTKCNRLKNTASLKILRLQYDMMRNDILSKFVDIDALIDTHGNDIANLESSVLPYLSTNKNQLLKQLTEKINKMDHDLQRVRHKWSNKSVQIERYLKRSLDRGIKHILKRYKLWNTEEVIDWVQFIIKDNVTFGEKDVESLKIANIAGFNLYNMDRDVMELIRVNDEVLQNIIMTSVHSLIERYDNAMEMW
eukprot:201768_1